MKLKYPLLIFFNALLLGCSAIPSRQLPVIPAESHGLPKEIVTQIDVDSIKSIGGGDVAKEFGPIGGVRHLSDLLIYPAIARRAGVSGSVTVRLLINTDGSVDSAKVVSSDVELFNQPSCDRLRHARFLHAPVGVDSSYSVFVYIRYSAINVERITISVLKYYPPLYTLTISNDCGIKYVTSHFDRKDTISTVYNYEDCRYVMTAIRSEILSIRNDYANSYDSSMVVTYVENGKSETFYGNPRLYHFWVINEIVHGVIDWMNRFHPIKH